MLGFPDVGILQHTVWLVFDCMSHMQSLPGLEDYEAMTVIVAILWDTLSGLTLLAGLCLEGVLCHPDTRYWGK